VKQSMILDIVIGVAVLGYLITRQLRARRVSSSGLRVVAILAVVGLVEASSYLRGNHGGAITYAALGGSLVLAAIFGILRASTVRIWSEGGQAWSQGNWLTAVLWIVALAAHLGYDYLVAHGNADRGVGSATVVLYLAVSLGVQRLVTHWRATRLQPLASP
jgi:hypothetical protein